MMWTDKWFFIRVSRPSLLYYENILSSRNIIKRIASSCSLCGPLYSLGIPWSTTFFFTDHLNPEDEDDLLVFIINNVLIKENRVFEERLEDVARDFFHILGEFYSSHFFEIGYFIVDKLRINCIVMLFNNLVEVNIYGIFFLRFTGTKQFRPKNGYLNQIV